MTAVADCFKFKVTSWEFENERYVCRVMQRLVLLQDELAKTRENVAEAFGSLLDDFFGECFGFGYAGDGAMVVAWALGVGSGDFAIIGVIEAPSH
jgi:hypothetical protein